MSGRSYVRLTMGLTVSAMLIAAGIAPGLSAAATPTRAIPARATAAAANQPLSATVSPMWQTNNTAMAIAVARGVVFAGGKFTKIRPPGSALGKNEVARTDLAGFSTTTGAPTSFAPKLNGEVDSLGVSPDGSTLYVGGTFTTVNGIARPHAAAFTVATGALTSWSPKVTGKAVDAIATYGSTVYLGGIFGSIGGVNHTDLAAVSATAPGAVIKAFTATAKGLVSSMALPADGSRLIVGGSFTALAGQTEHAIGSVDPVTGAPEPWATNDILVDTPTCDADSESVIVSGQIAYVAGDGEQAGCYDGDFAANVSDGSLVWNSVCEGATAAVFMLNNVLYKGSHMHDCSINPGGAGGGWNGAITRKTFVFHRLGAQDPTNGSFIHWFPTTNGDNGVSKGPEAFASDGTQLFVAGSFSTVNSVGQEGIARFSPGPSRAPDKPTLAPHAVASAPGSVTVTVPGVNDRDTGTLTYTLFRGTKVVGTATAESWPWTQPSLRFTDTRLTAGSSVSYRYTASDGTSTTAQSPASVPVVVSSSVPSYPTSLAALSPSLDWQLDDSTGSLADSSGHGETGDAEGTVTLQQPGVIAGNAAVSLDGSSGFLTSDAPLPSQDSFSESTWFKTSTVTGGVLLVTSTEQAAGSGTGDDAVWMDDDGQLTFGMQTPIVPPASPFSLPDTIARSPLSYNDGRWHQVVATYDGSAMTLFVDGSQVATNAATAAQPFGGFLRVGYGDLSGLPHVFGLRHAQAPISNLLNGSVDEVSVFPTALTAGQVSSVWASGATAP